MIKNRFNCAEGFELLLLRRSHRFVVLIAAAAAGLVLAGPAAAFAASGDSQAPQQRDLTLNQVNLASDIPGMAPLTDPDLKNPWGISHTATSPLWVSDEGKDASTLYTLTPGSSTVTKVSTVRVTTPGPFNLGPTGQVANPGNGFVENKSVANPDGTFQTVSAPAAFIFASFGGALDAWNPTTDPLIGDAEPEGTHALEYTGLTVASTPSGDELFAADFEDGTVQVFNSKFQPVTTAGGFTDPRLPKGYLPFNTQALQGHIFVTYDKAEPLRVPNPTGANSGIQAVGEGLGVVDEFSTDGRLISRIVSGGKLDAPWGLAIAPGSWGPAAGSLLVGNFGDGRINVIAKDGTHFADRVTGQVRDKSTGKFFAEPGLFSLLPGTAANGGTGALWFTSGVNANTARLGSLDALHGLLGVLRP
jgi:uncharacterized protein (TIGR03118 family)